MGIMRTKRQGILKDDFLKEINDGHYIELTDRAHVMASMFHDHIVEHPLAIENKEIKQAADEIGTSLYEFYQLVASKMFDKSE
jgi:hypothetical protein